MWYIKISLSTKLPMELTKTHFLEHPATTSLADRLFEKSFSWHFQYYSSFPLNFFDLNYILITIVFYSLLYCTLRIVHPTHCFHYSNHPHLLFGLLCSTWSKYPRYLSCWFFIFDLPPISHRRAFKRTNYQTYHTLFWYDFNHRYMFLLIGCLH